MSKDLVTSNGIWCLRCRGRLILDTENDENVCSKCGMVASISQNVLNSKSYSVSTGTERIASSSIMHELDLSTSIDQSNVDANGTQIGETYEINKIRKLNNVIFFNNSKTRNLTKARWELRRILESLGVGTAVAERAWYIYTKAFKKSLIRGRSINGFVAAAIYVACRNMDVPCSIGQLQELTGNLKKKTIGYYCKLLIRELQMNVSLPSPSVYVSRTAKSIGLSTHVERKALEILELVQDHETLAGKRPVSLAAAAIYLASEHNGSGITQLRIANATNLNTGTIRKRCLEIAKLMEIMKPTDSNGIEEQKLTIHPVSTETETSDLDLAEQVVVLA